MLEVYEFNPTRRNYGRYEPERGERACEKRASIIKERGERERERVCLKCCRFRIRLNTAYFAEN